MDKIIIIGLLGKAYSGKSTAAKYLSEKHGFKILSFGTLIKDIAVKYFNVSQEEAYITKPIHVRDILQGIGTFIREEIDDNYFTNKMSGEIFWSEVKKIVIDDVRLIEEVQFIKGMNGTIIKIECLNSPHKLVGNQSAHVTEQIDEIPYDHLISVEYGDLTKLTNSIDKLCIRR